MSNEPATLEQLRLITIILFFGILVVAFSLEHRISQVEQHVKQVEASR